MQKKPFAELGLAPELLKAVAKIGYEEASPIQAETIPQLLGGADIVGLSQTGSGKTAAFGIPAVQLADPTQRSTQVLILCPTRELAVQVAEEIAKLAFFKKGLRELPIYGGSAYDRQLRGLREGAHIVIGTPGRLIDHLERGSLRLDQLKMVVLDEADRMLDMGFRDDIEAILQKAPAERQTVFFSATMPPAIQQLIKRYGRSPVNVRIQASQLTVPAIDQVYYEVDRRSKIEVLCRLIDLQDINYALIFCATKIMVDDLADHLSARGYSCDKLHGGISQATRERVMAKFRRRAVDFLVATDVAARGLDVEDIEVVFNYDLPNDAEDYVHRIGRTGRAGRSGRAITFVAGREIYRIEQIARFTKTRIRRERVPSAEQVEQKRTSEFFEKLRTTLQKGEYQSHDGMIEQLLEQGYAATEIANALIDLLSREVAREVEPVRQEERPARAPARLAAPRARDRFESDAAPAKPRRESAVPKRRARMEEPAALDVDGVTLDEIEAMDDEPRRPRARAARVTDKRVHRREMVSPVSHEPGMTRLVMNVGKTSGVGPGDVVGVIANLANLERQEIGAIELREQQTFVDVAEDKATRVLKKLKGIRFKGRKLTIEPAA